MATSIADTPEPPRKKQRHARTTSGCKDCRTRRIKCPEGKALPDGRKEICSRCYVADVECWYPCQTGRKGEWERAGPMSAPSAADAQDAPAAPVVPEMTVAVKDAPACELPTGDMAWLSDFDPFSPSALVSWTQQTDCKDVTSTASVSVIELPPVPADNQSPIFPIELLPFLQPDPTAPLSLFCLSSMASVPADRLTISYFESKGWNEITVASKMTTNWIYYMLFPRIYLFLCDPSSSTGCRRAIRDYVYHSLLRLSFVHRGNTTREPDAAAQHKMDAKSHQERAGYALTKAKVMFAEGSWKTEEYLMGFFVNCMADMLDSQRFTIDHSTTFDLPEQNEFSASLRDMIGVYSLVMTACAPQDPSLLRSLPGAMTAPFELAAEGSHWVELFFGVSRPMLIKIGQINKLIMSRMALIRAGQQDSLAGLLIRPEAERLATSLGTGWLWNEELQPIGKSPRIQRGTEVTRAALLVMVLCELLEVDIVDKRIVSMSERVAEIVADTLPEETAGYTFACSVVAVYTKDPARRDLIRSTIRAAQIWSFGVGYLGVDQIMTACWRLYDEEGRYPNGIAPWRELIASSGRSMYI